MAIITLGESDLMARQPLPAAPVARLLGTVALGALLAATGPAEAVAATTPVPTLAAVPTTPTSRPYGSTDPGTANLGASGYVQEEFFISGTASG
jgi:hypothetical protein